MPEDTHPAKTQTEEDTVIVDSKPEQRMEFRKDSGKAVAPVTTLVTKNQNTVRQVARTSGHPPYTKNLRKLPTRSTST
ncbi:hypothetical protein BGX38DRAFT_1225688 [Terfezia claveryi]|nr:hypothetical protein BGX38DRAFT_1225688 [Terfezia claveryi]